MKTCAVVREENSIERFRRAMEIIDRIFFNELTHPFILALSSKTFLLHNTIIPHRSSLDTENIRFVFAAVKDTILQLNLKEYNLV